MLPPQSERRAPRRWTVKRWTLIGGSAVLVVLVLAFVSSVPFSSDRLRRKVVETLSERLDAEVELADVHVRAFPRFRAEAIGLAIRKPGLRDAPPLIVVRRLTVDSGVMDLVRKHVSEVRLEGLEINISPRPNQDASVNPEATGSNPEAPSADGDQEPGAQAPAIADPKDIVVDHLYATDARLVIIPSKPEKRPKVWAIHQLHMQSVAFDRGMPFEATLTNAVPPGEIQTRGIFGPWGTEDPGATPLEGTFTFDRADLGFFKGISGMLSAHGEFGGSLGKLGVHGETDTPDFTVAVGGHPVPLHTDYHATVDGTNGDTLLDRIDASFLNTSLVAKGGVVDTPGQDGRTVTVDVVMEHARLEDVLLLAVKAPKPPMTGALTLKNKLVIPPGDRDVADKLKLDGDFAIANTRFTDPTIQKKVNGLSRLGQGKVDESEAPNVASDFKGRFRLDSGTLFLPALAFDIPGAGVHLAGAYHLKAETLGFKGDLFMDAKISETQRGWKRLLLKLVDPLFKRQGGGSTIPIKIEGRRSDPSFGLDRGRVFRRGK